MSETNTLPALENSAVKSVVNPRRSASKVPLEETVARVEDPKRLGMTLVRLIPPFRSPTGRWNYRGEYRCNLCGRVVNVERDHARRKQTCGCYDTHTRHGHARDGKRSTLYRRWTSMKDRCLNPHNNAFSCYGGRGITICSEWMTFPPFAHWALGSGFRKELELDRIDVNGNYAPDNCRWATPQQNIHNRRVTKLSYEITHGVKVLSGAGFTPSQIARITKLARDNVWQIINGTIWMETDETSAALHERLRASDRNINGPTAVNTTNI